MTYIEIEGRQRETVPHGNTMTKELARKIGNSQNCHGGTSTRLPSATLTTQH